MKRHVLYWTPILFFWIAMPAVAQPPGPRPMPPPEPTLGGPPADEAIWAAHESAWIGPAVGEDYRLEMSAGLWSPVPDLVASSEQFGIPGTAIDFRSDLGLVRQSHGELRLTFKPGRRHKLRLQWVPMRYQQSAVLPRDLVFQGIRYATGTAVESSVSWSAWRFGYELDVLVRDRGYIGLILEAKYTDLKAELISPIDSEYARARAPIPAIGVVGRAYISRFTPITVEVTGFGLPDGLLEDYDAQFVDFDIYGTVNLTRMVGISLGYRSMDLSYLLERNLGDFTVAGVYLSGVFRF